MLCKSDDTNAFKVNGIRYTKQSQQYYTISFTRKQHLI